jgi:hypothetical protein
LLDCWIVGLLDCWIVGLLDCWIVGLLDRPNRKISKNPSAMRSNDQDIQKSILPVDRLLSDGLEVFIRLGEGFASEETAVRR